MHYQVLVAATGKQGDQNSHRLIKGIFYIAFVIVFYIGRFILWQVEDE